MLIEHATDPLVRRKEEHVIAVAVRPIGHGHARVMRGDQAAHEDERESRTSRQHGNSVQKAIVSGTAFVKRLGAEL